MSPVAACSGAQLMEALMSDISRTTRELLQNHRQQHAGTLNPGTPPPLLSMSLEPRNPAHLYTADGACATMRLAQPILAGYCAKLPGTDR